MFALIWLTKPNLCFYINNEEGLAILSEKTINATKVLKQPFKSSPFRRELREKCDEMNQRRQQKQIDGGERMPMIKSSSKQNDQEKKQNEWIKIKI